MSEKHPLLCGDCGGQWTREHDCPIERYRIALNRLLAVLGDGDCPDNPCKGCKHEMAEAVQIAREVLG